MGPCAQRPAAAASHPRPPPPRTQGQTLAPSAPQPIVTQTSMTSKLLIPIPANYHKLPQTTTNYQKQNYQTQITSKIPANDHKTPQDTSQLPNTNYQKLPQTTTNYHKLPQTTSCTWRLGINISTQESNGDLDRDWRTRRNGGWGSGRLRYPS